MFRSQKFSLQTAPRLVLSAALVLVTIAWSACRPLLRKPPQPTLPPTSPMSAPLHDTNLVNPWGMVASPSSPWWVSDNGTGLSTLYDGTGSPKSLVVTIPPGTVAWHRKPGRNCS